MFTDLAQSGFLPQIGNPVAARQMALQSLDNLREQHALALSYFDAILFFAVAGVDLALLVPGMKRSVVEKGTINTAK